MEMTSVDGLLEVSYVAWGNAVSILALLITLLSAYLVAAYLAGRSMTRSQVIIINTLYILLSTFLLWGLVNMALRAASFEDIAYAMAEGELAAFSSQKGVALGVVTIFSFAILASLKFMWDVRRPDNS